MNQSALRRTTAAPVASELAGTPRNAANAGAATAQTAMITIARSETALKTVVT